MKTFQEMYINVGMANRDNDPTKNRMTYASHTLPFLHFLFCNIEAGVQSERVYVLISYTGGVCCRCSFCRRLMGQPFVFCAIPTYGVLPYSMIEQAGFVFGCENWEWYKTRCARTL